MSAVEDLFKKYDVDGYYSGQDGILQVLEDRFSVSNRSLSYFVSGAGGDFYRGNLTSNSKSVFGLNPSEEGYLLQTLTVNELKTQVIGRNGNVAFEYTCVKTSNFGVSKCG